MFGSKDKFYKIHELVDFWAACGPLDKVILSSITVAPSPSTSQCSNNAHPGV